MRRSLGGGSSMGGGNGGGGGMLRSVHRAVRAGVGGAQPEPFSPSAGSGSVSTSSSRKTKKSHVKQPSSPKRNLTLSNSSSINSINGSSAFSSLINLPISAAFGAAAPEWRVRLSPACEDLEWEVVEGSGGYVTAAHAFYDDFVFGTVPSRDEVQHAISALQQVSSVIRYPSSDDSGMDSRNENGSPTGITRSISADELESDWVEPSAYLYDHKMLQPQGSQRVYDAFHLLQTDPSVQRMVVSLSSDKAVWDAVLNNDVVRELRSSITQVDNEVRESAEAASASDDGSNPLKDIMNWVFENTREKIMELINKITKIVHDVVHPSNEGKKDDTTDSTEEKLRTSLLLSVVVLLIVVISRVQGAGS